MRHLIYILLWILAAAIALSIAPSAAPAAGTRAWLEIGGAAFDGWKGLSVSAGIATLPASGQAIFRYPRGPKGWSVSGFRILNDSSRDWRDYYGLQIDLRVPAGHAVDLEVDLLTPPPALRQEYLPAVHAISTVGAGWHRVTIPWSAFGVSATQLATMGFIQEVDLTTHPAAGSQPSDVDIKNIRLIRAPAIAIESDIRGKAVAPDESARYDVTVTNCADAAATIKLAFAPRPWTVMAATVDPALLTLQPGESANCVVTVQLPAEGVPPGGHETQRLIATSDGDATTSASIEFITARQVEHPYILHTAERWNEIREKVKDYAWAKQALDDNINIANAWVVPTAALPPNNVSREDGHAYVFTNINFVKLLPTLIAWQTTRDKKYAEKLATFLRRLADDKTGYPSTFGGTDEGGPQEGENFQSVAIAYDGILDAGVLTDADRRAIEHTFRLYMQTFERDLTVGNVGNWSVAQSTACLFEALAMGDLAAADRYINGPCGFTDFVSKGIMDDGWWWECSTSYNFWVATELTQAALACQPWGIDLINLNVPASYSRNSVLTPWALHPLYGMSFDKWGPIRQTTHCIKQLWDAIPAVADYRGITFGMNDGHEEFVGGTRLEVAYYVFRDPAYAAILRRGAKRDLLYGVPDLPSEPNGDGDDQPRFPSHCAENIGYALLRSQTPNRPPSEQIQAVFKIGTQGGFHGHFDRVSLDNITRYGRGFWNPESIWYGYANYMYKFYVQTSVAGNMVVVDQKQQEAVPSSQLLFYAGKMMQVSAQETNARWSDPPYGGMQYNPGDTFAGQMRKNEQSIPPVTDRQYGTRRLGIVTDDYVVIDDYLKSSSPHAFDNLLQLKGFKSLDADGKSLIRHDGQYNPDPRGAAQFITDCDWYQTRGPAIGRFQCRFGPGADNTGTRQALNEDGVLNLDIHSLWPRQQQIMIATAPETHNEQQWVHYKIEGDGKTLAEGESGVWILGAVDIDVPVKGIGALTLTLTTDGGVALKTPEATTIAKKKSLFWANPRFVLADGSEQPAALPSATTNAEQSPVAGKDYYGGPIKIAGIAYADAIPAQPKDIRQPSVISISLAGKQAARFRATLGGDFPFGDESQRRKVYCIRSTGDQARFLTLIEPYDRNPMVTSAIASGPDALHVELADGRAQDIKIDNLDADGKQIVVSINESKGGKPLRAESTNDR